MRSSASGCAKSTIHPAIHPTVPHFGTSMLFSPHAPGLILVPGVVLDNHVDMIKRLGSSRMCFLTLLSKALFSFALFSTLGSFKVSILTNIRITQTFQKYMDYMHIAD